MNKLIEDLESVFTIRVFLDHDPYKVLVRTILSQRTRDENTDQATDNLFAKYKDIYEVVDAPIDDVKELIRPAGFYNVKAAVLSRDNYTCQICGEKDSKFEVKYYAKVEKIVEKPSTRIGSLNDYHIWTRDHVKSYLCNSKAQVWILRVYELDEPKYLSRTRGMRYANVDEEVLLDNLKPVLSNSEFEKILKGI